MQAMTAVSWGADVRGDVTLIRRMNDNFYGQDENGVRFCVNPTSKKDKHKNCPKIEKLFDLAFQEPKLLIGFVLRVEAKYVPDNETLDWMASTCRYELQPAYIQKEIDNILESAAKTSAIVHQPTLSNPVDTFIDANPSVIIQNCTYDVAEIDEANNKVSIQNRYVSQILRAVAAQHNVHISQVAAACVNYCITHDSILFRMNFDDQPAEQSK